MISSSVFNRIHKRTFICALAAAGLALGMGATSGPAFAQAKYPDRPVKVIVPFGAGGVADITARIVGEKLGNKLGQRFVIENVPAAGGIQAAQNVLREPADGYTLSLFSNGTAVSVGLFNKLAFDPVTQFAPVSSMGFFDFIFATGANKPYKSMEELLKFAKANPGKINIGTVVIGSTQNLSAQLFKSEAGIDAAIVPFKTTPDLLLATLNGDIDIMIDSYASMRSNIDDGKLRALGSSGPKRSEAHTNIPTVAEGGVPGFDVVSWNAFFVRAETPKDVIATLNTAMREVLADPDTHKRALELGIETRGGTPEEIGKRLTDDIKRWSSVIEKAGIEKR
ncbi:MAG: tripartite tricarboxylate transporter substrate binding protein [Beijerinckiaceae bacterium]|nr:tripartite tricarboxylate transporter substrate binding protein [Beijerinckiaceae bacterium]